MYFLLRTVCANCALRILASAHAARLQVNIVYCTTLHNDVTTVVRRIRIKTVNIYIKHFVEFHVYQKGTKFIIFHLLSSVWRPYLTRSKIKGRLHMFANYCRGLSRITSKTQSHSCLLKSLVNSFIISFLV